MPWFSRRMILSSTASTTETPFVSFSFSFHMALQFQVHLFHVGVCAHVPGQPRPGAATLLRLVRHVEPSRLTITHAYVLKMPAMPFSGGKQSVMKY